MNIEEIIKSVNKSWPKNYIIRYLYVKLAPFLARDIKFFLASPEQKEFELEKNINRFPFINCSTLADFYINLFASFNINAIKIEATKTKIPLHAIIVEGDNGWFYLCPINDLLNNQIGNRTSHFGELKRNNRNFVLKEYPFLTELTLEEIDRIDANLGIKNLVYFWAKLRNEMFHSNYFYEYFHVNRNDSLEVIKAKLDFINKHLINIPIIPGPLEREGYYRYLIRRICRKDEKESINVSLDITRRVVNITDYSSEIPIYYEERTIFSENKNLYVLERKK